MTSYAEDLPPGTSVALGSYTAGAAEMIAFAEQWDPQPFHTDVEFSRAGHFGEVIASGLYTLGVFQRLAVLGALHDWAVVAGRRIRSIEFPAPVTDGMVLHGRIEVEEALPTRPERTLLVLHGTLHRDDGAVVFDARFETYLRNRAGGTSKIGTVPS